MYRILFPGRPDTPAAAQHSVLTIQALRAIAALLVVVYHAVEMWGERIDPNAPGVHWTNGAAGVDIFFVISGFVMVIASRKLTDKPAGWAEFLRHRIVRIVPLYWVLTTVKVAAVLILPALAVRTSTDPNFILGSYLFLPVIDQAHHFRPVIPVGWTLSYEMTFYLLFALALWLRTDVLRIAIPGLGAIAVLALLRDTAWPEWTLFFTTLVLEFIFGVLLAKWMIAGHRLPPLLASVLVIAGGCAIMLLPQSAENLRVLNWGLPAFAIVAGAVSLEPIVGRMIPRWLLSLGDASYSVYLGHGFVLPTLVLLVGRMLPHNIVTQCLAIALCLFASAAIGWLLYVCVEQPLLRALRSRRSAPDAIAPVPEAAR